MFDAEKMRTDLVEAIREMNPPAAEVREMIMEPWMELREELRGAAQ